MKLNGQKSDGTAGTVPTEVQQKLAGAVLKIKATINTGK